MKPGPRPKDRWPSGCSWSSSHWSSWFNITGAANCRVEFKSLKSAPMATGRV